MVPNCAENGAAAKSHFAIDSIYAIYILAQVIGSLFACFLAPWSWLTGSGWRELAGGSWPGAGWELAGSWPGAGRQLAGSCPGTGRELAGSWPGAGRELGGSWPAAGRHLAGSWPGAGWELPGTWPAAGRHLGRLWGELWGGSEVALDWFCVG